MKALAVVALSLACLGCSKDDSRIDVIFDTDANNEIDDQHAIAYLLLSDDVFNVLGITTNTTYNGGKIELQSLEAKRVTKLVGKGDMPVYDGADGPFEEILPKVKEKEFDGHVAVNFIIKQARKHSRKEPLTVIAVGKLTNLALALAKKPSISKRMRLVWLGTNYPQPGEYNFVNDIPAVNYRQVAGGKRKDGGASRHRLPHGKCTRRLRPGQRSTGESPAPEYSCCR